MAARAALHASLALLLLASLCALCHGQAFYTGTDVVELTASTFRSKVLEDDHVWMVEVRPDVSRSQETRVEATR